MRPFSSRCSVCGIRHKIVVCRPFDELLPPVSSMGCLTAGPPFAEHFLEFFVDYLLHGGVSWAVSLFNRRWVLESYFVLYKGSKPLDLFKTCQLSVQKFLGLSFLFFAQAFQCNWSLDGAGMSRVLVAHLRDLDSVEEYLEA